jgi:hypothetical protein
MWMEQNPLVIQVIDASLPMGTQRGLSAAAVGLSGHAQAAPGLGSPADHPHFQNPLPLISRY